MGDPAGIGPEVLVKALSDDALRQRAAFMVFGDDAAMRAAAVQCGVAVAWSVGDRPIDGGVVVRTPEPGDPIRSAPAPAGPDITSGELSFRWVERGIAAALLPATDPGHADALVTGPISKQAWSLAGHGEFPGHTELLAARCGATRFAMMFHAPPRSRPGASQRSLDTIGLNVILVTTHIPLAQVPAALTESRVRAAIELGHEAVAALVSGDSEMGGGGLGGAPRIGVCGLNPHAGEQGLLGREDDAVIAPAIGACRAAGIDVRGPFPADTIFHRALAFPGVRPEFDLVVAMYHDQGLAPLKLLARDRAVNMTVGLPIVRTSPDHGTAFDIVGRGVADEGSMHAALALAIDLAARRRDR